MDVLEALYDRISVGGFIVVVGYGGVRWGASRRAVDEFRESRGLVDAIQWADDQVAFWRKSAIRSKAKIRSKGEKLSAAKHIQRNYPQQSTIYSETIRSKAYTAKLSVAKRNYPATKHR